MPAGTPSRGGIARAREGASRGPLDRTFSAFVARSAEVRYASPMATRNLADPDWEPSDEDFAELILHGGRGHGADDFAAMLGDAEGYRMRGRQRAIWPAIQVRNDARSPAKLPGRIRLTPNT